MTLEIEPFYHLLNYLLRFLVVAKVRIKLVNKVRLAVLLGAFYFFFFISISRLFRLPFHQNHGRGCLRGLRYFCRWIRGNIEEGFWEGGTAVVRIVNNGWNAISWIEDSKSGQEGIRQRGKCTYIDEIINEGVVIHLLDYFLKYWLL